MSANLSSMEEGSWGVIIITPGLRLRLQNTMKMMEESASKNRQIILSMSRALLFQEKMETQSE